MTVAGAALIIEIDFESDFPFTLHHHPPKGGSQSVKQLQAPQAGGTLTIVGQQVKEKGRYRLLRQSLRERKQERTSKAPIRYARTVLCKLHHTEQTCVKTKLAEA